MVFCVMKLGKKQGRHDDEALIVCNSDSAEELYTATQKKNSNKRNMHCTRLSSFSRS